MNWMETVVLLALALLVLVILFLRVKRVIETVEGKEETHSCNCCSCSCSCTNPQKIKDATDFKCENDMLAVHEDSASTPEKIEN